MHYVALCRPPHVACGNAWHLIVIKRQRQTDKVLLLRKGELWRVPGHQVLTSASQEVDKYIRQYLNSFQFDSAPLTRVQELPRQCFLKRVVHSPRGQKRIQGSDEMGFFPLDVALRLDLEDTTEDVIKHLLLKQTIAAGHSS